MCKWSRTREVKAINRPWWWSNKNTATKHWNGRCAEDECVSRDTGVAKEPDKYINTVWGWGSRMGYLQMGYVHWSVSCSDSWCFIKASEGDMSLQLQWFLQFVPVIGSRELEGKVAKGRIGFGGDQWDIPARARATGGCCYGDQWAEIRLVFT
jgi:hypothetical protein